MKKVISSLLLGVCLLLAGCSETKEPETRPQEPEPTAVYDWMAGESPVPNQRSGRYRYGENLGVQASSPTGVYFLEQKKVQREGHEEPTDEFYITYAEHGSDKIVKLCGRVDCTHNSEDCNACIYRGMCLSYTNGYLYAVSGLNDTTRSELIRMEPDGSNHVVEMDLLRFAKECGGDMVNFAFINDGVLVLDLYYWKKSVSGMSESLQGTYLGTYYYKLDGSMEKPEKVVSGMIFYSCGNVFLASSPDAQQGGEHGSEWSWDPDTNTETYLTDSIGRPGYFDEDEAYYFLDGAIRRKTYADNQETVLVDTGLKGKYVLTPFPDCLMLASQEEGEGADRNLYFYNWAFELVETVEIDYDFSGMADFLLVAETAERFILTDCFRGIPKYYINKAELGTGNVEIHEFQRLGDSEQEKYPGQVDPFG